MIGKLPDSREWNGKEQNMKGRVGVYGAFHQEHPNSMVIIPQDLVLKVLEWG